MDIDILKDPPSRAELDSESQALQKRLRKLRIGVAFSFALLLFFLIKVLEGNGETDPLLIVMAVVVIPCVIAFGSFLTSVEEYQREEVALQCVTPDDCIRIQTYLADPDVKAYRDKVVEQSRKFVQVEVEAMKEYYDGREKREACRAVYGVTEGEA